MGLLLADRGLAPTLASSLHLGCEVMLARFTEQPLRNRGVTVLEPQVRPQNGLHGLRLIRRQLAPLPPLRRHYRSPPTEFRRPRATPKEFCRPGPSPRSATVAACYRRRRQLRQPSQTPHCALSHLLWGPASYTSAREPAGQPSKKDTPRTQESTHALMAG